MRRFFVPPENLQLDPVPLTEEIVHHLGAVLRLQTGDEIMLLDGQGRLAAAASSRSAAGRHRTVLECRQETEGALPVRLLQGLPKATRWIWSQRTELGFSVFTPVLAERSIPAPSADGKKRRQRWGASSVRRPSRATSASAG
jgi:16S rRNA (uracil1498-N3)-methyltransferase